MGLCTRAHTKAHTHTHTHTHTPPYAASGSMTETSLYTWPEVS